MYCVRHFKDKEEEEEEEEDKKKKRGDEVRYRLRLNLTVTIRFVPRSKHSVSVIKTNQLMLHSEIIAVCSEIHKKHINTLCGQNVECRAYRAVNTLPLSYKNQPVNDVQ
jgi:hypothetical protein